MFCPKCGKEETGNAAFCRGCGERLGSPVIGAVKPSCPKCLRGIDGDPAFCPYCSEPLKAGVGRKTSWAWWLLPILLTWLGGIIAYLCVRRTDPAKANRLMTVGFILFAVFGILNLILLFGGVCSSSG
jgi:hypothetical protein